MSHNGLKRTLKNPEIYSNDALFVDGPGPVPRYLLESCSDVPCSSGAVQWSTRGSSSCSETSSVGEAVQFLVLGMESYFESVSNSRLRQ